MQYCTFYLLRGIYHGFALNTKLPDGSKVYVRLLWAFKQQPMKLRQF